MELIERFFKDQSRYFRRPIDNTVKNFSGPNVDLLRNNFRFFMNFIKDQLIFLRKIFKGQYWIFYKFFKEVTLVYIWEILWRINHGFLMNIFKDTSHFKYFQGQIYDLLIKFFQGPIVDFLKN